MGPLKLSDHVVQNHQTEELMTRADMLNKATKFEFSLFFFLFAYFLFVLISLIACRPVNFLMQLQKFFVWKKRIQSFGVQK